MTKVEKTANKGFTLIEMLAVVAIFIVIGGIATSILVSSFQTAHKTDIVTAVQNNGNYTISQMAKTIRDARGLITPFPCSPPVVSDTITVTTPDDQQVTYACNGTTIASNGASMFDTSQVVLKDCSFTCSQDSRSDLPIILINFSLQQATSSKFSEQIASQSAVVFQTSVGIRNINR